MSGSNTHHTVESICKLGCVRVNEIIDLLESGKNIEETANFTADEIQTVLQELKTIMSVYEKKRS